MSSIILDKKSVMRNPDKPVYFFKFKDKDGRWRPKFIPTTERTEADREAWKALFLTAQEANQTCLATVVVKEKTIRSLTPWWIAFLVGENVSPEVLKEFKHALRLYIEPHSIASLECEKIKPSDAKEYVKWLLKQVSKKTKTTLAPHTVRNVLKTLRTFFMDAVAEEKLDKDLQNPFQHANLRRILPVFKNKRGTINIVFEAEAFEKLLDSPLVPNLHRVRFIIAAHGAREQEQAGWRWSDLKEKNGLSYLRIERQLKAKITGERLRPELGAPKEEASNRDLPLHKTAVDALSWWRSVGWKELVGRLPLPTDPIFPNAKGEPCNWVDGSKQLRRALRRAGLPASYEARPERWFLFNVKAFRSTFATWLELAGTSLERRQALMGHTGETVMDAHYIGRNLASYQEEIDKLPLPAWKVMPSMDATAEAS